MNRSLLAFAATVFVCISVLSCCFDLSVSADSVNTDGYDLSGFAAAFPEVFSKDDEITVTPNSYRSHDVCINMSRYQSPYLSGDLNADRKVTIQDVVLCCKIIAEVQVADLTDAAFRNADCDLSGTLNLSDLRNMLSYLAGTMTAQDFFAESSVVYHIADIYIRNIESFRSCFAKDQFPPKGSYLCDYALNVAPKHNALCMINADYVECRSYGVIWRNGVHYRDVQFGGNDICVLYHNGEMEILTYNEYVALPDERKSAVWQTSNFSKALVKDGVPQAFSRAEGTGGMNDCHPRSSMGYYEPGHYVFVQVDGRQAGYSAGMYLDELAELYAELGVRQAYNMDGGSSSSLIFNGALYNTPAPVHVGDTLLGRPTSDFFYICEPSQIPDDLAAAAWGTNPPET